MDALEEGRSRSWKGRLAGSCGVAFVVLAFAGVAGVLGRDLYFSRPADDSIVAWAAGQGPMIARSAYIDAFSTTVFFGLLILLLVDLAGDRGLFPVIAHIGTGVVIAISWIQVGMAYAMVQLAQRGGEVSGVVTLFKLGETMQLIDSMGVAMAIGASSVLAMRRNLLPAPLAWFGVAVALFHVPEPALQAAGAGLLGPLGIVTGLVWVLAASITLLVRPAGLGRNARAGVPASA